MTPLADRIRALLDPKTFSNSIALKAVDAAQLFESYFTHVEPQPMGTPKQIFRMGYAKGAEDNQKQNEKLAHALADVARTLDHIKTEAQIAPKPDPAWMADQALKQLASIEALVASLEKR